MALIKEKADLWGIDVDATSRIRGKSTKNLVGHKDLTSTLCPGENIDELIPYIRSSIDKSLEIYSYDDDDEFAYETVNDWEPIYLNPQDEAEITFQLKNICTETWNSDTHLVANLDYEGEKIVSLNRASDDSIAPMNESSVAPGQTGTFTVTLNSNLAGGFVDFDITPIYNGYKKTPNYMSLTVYVEAPDLSHSTTVDLGAERLKTDDDMSVTVEVENEGNVVWKNYGDYPVMLTGDELMASLEVEMNESEVEPGETATFEFSVEGPEVAGTYHEQLILMFGDHVTSEDDDNYFEILVYNPSKQAEYSDKSDKVEFYPGEEAEVWIELLNTGYQDWTPSNVTVGFVKYSAIGAEDAYLVETRIEPGETGKIKFTIEAPTELGDFKINIKPRVDGRNLTPTYFYYEFSVVEGSTASYSMPDVRVALSFEGDPKITADGRFAMYSNDSLIRNFSEDDKVEVSFDGLNYQVRSGGFAWVLDAFPTFKPGSSSVLLEIENFENRPAWNEDLNDNRFRGDLEVRDVEC